MIESESPMGDPLTHINKEGEAVMVDVSAKAETTRVAVAEGRIRMNEAAFRAISEGSAKKGDVLAAARIAGIMAVKNTPDLIPLCHRLLIEKATVTFTFEEDHVLYAQCEVKTSGKTGVEMEALCGVSVALLTVYDMAKAIDRSMEIYDVRVVSKAGGKSGDYERQSR